ncbi:Nif3-like dinuclear metal center hexameric protein [Paenactinomyces guangxiensis]|uniref:GTP cyclohydrolase 1 type 2 homolog n=1 Tax=Paenactinomyces guangxiensis TaxID=1490290 RepID=A0A7W1WNJ9_9BACL|nr:Nif3-like dinuclear metal center hexameric protein [Paenactinomyces guangxiensis]MBH8589971.1 Nif3-like dinuclear metal center hexameric protein [Paenactinomyces guangxiensis]
MAVRGAELIQCIDTYAPPSLAIENDRIGLQIGEPNTIVTGVLVTLDVTEAVVDEAIQKGANWIVAHHAVIYQPLKSIRTDQPAGRMIAKMLRHGINVYIAHTNLDAADDGVNDVLAEKLQLKETKVLIPYGEEKLKKLVVFVPEDHHDKLLQALGEAGAGWIGNYSHCTFNTPGVGTFLPTEGTNPFIGKQGQLEKVKEIRLETVVPERIERQVIDAMLNAHPYEEVAYDVYPLEIKGKDLGFGRVGRLEQPVSLGEFARHVKQAYQLEGLRITGDLQQKVQSVAVLGGSGGRYFMDAKRAGADVYITGDIDYHVAQDALAHGLHVIDPGHHVEHLVVERVCQVLMQKLEKAVPIYASRVNTNPFRFF